MPSHRSLRIAEAIREVVASAILFEVSDPRVRAVTVLHVEVSGDMHSATVYVSIMGTEAEQQTVLNALKHAGGFLQAKVAARLQTRFTPVLSFKRDDSVKKSIEMARLIDDALAADRHANGPADPTPAVATDEEEEAAEDEEEETADGGPASEPEQH